MRHINNTDTFIEKNKRLTYILGFIFLFFNYNISLNYIITGIVSLLVLLVPLNYSIMIYLFLFPWELSLALPKSGALNTLVALIVVFKILLKAFKGQKIGLTKVNILLIPFISIYTFKDLLIYNSKAGFGILMDIIILIYVYKLKKENNDIFWETVFNIYIISTLFACGYGILHNTFNDRWITGIGYVPQFYGTLGTSRMAMVINIAILFTLVLKFDKIRKFLTLSFLYIMLFMTISMAGFGTNIGALLYYFFVIYPAREGRLKYSKKYLLRFVQAILLFILIILLLFLLKDRIGIIDVMFTRVNVVINRLLTGETDRALSGRVDIYSNYIQVFNSLTAFEKIFGLGCFSPYEALGFSRYSHNSFIDLLFLGGYFLLFCFIFLVIYLILKEGKTKYFKVILLMKIILIINGLNVSMLTAGFWYFWLFI